MAYKCFICGKGQSAGKTISHSHRATNRTFKPNLQSQRIIVNGKICREYVCTRCVRSGKIQKAI
jgi:large subunit ribosomal protein L28